MIPKLLCLVGQIIRVHADTVPADKPRLELQEIPFRPRCLKHGLGVNPHFIKNNRQLIHEGDIDIALAVLNDFCRLRDLNRRRAVHACLHHQLIHMGDLLERLLVHAGHNLCDGLQAVHLIARIDALWRVADLEIHTALQAGFFLKNRHADILCDTGIDCRLKHDNRALCKILPQNAACALHRRQVRRVIVVDRRRHCHNMKLCFAQHGGVCCKRDLCRLDHLVAHLVCGVYPRLIKLNLCGVQIKTHHFYFFGKSDSDRHTYIAKTH